MQLVMNGLAAASLCLLAASAANAAEVVHDVTAYGAAGDGVTLCTGAIQKAIDACSKEGGGVVMFPAGTYLSGALRMKSGVTLLLEAEARLLGSTKLEDYYGPQSDAEGKPVEGKPVFRNLIQGEGLHDITIRGKGTIEGNGHAFRDKKKPRAKCIYLINCRNVLVEDVNLRNAGSWMQHYRLCQKLTVRNVNVFNHVAYNNDGMNIDSCRDVTITNCRVDSDDDGIVLKSLSETPCRNVKVSDCVVSSHCNALKLGTESGGGFINISISNCKVFSPKHSESTYGRQRGLAGIALEMVDGGVLENVSVSGVDIEGVSVPIFLRLGNRARPYVKDARPDVGRFHNVSLSDITARGTSPIGCSITGLPGHPVCNVAMSDISLGFEGGGTKELTQKDVPERENSYPESTMFGDLPAYGFYCRHARNLVFNNLKLHTEAPDLRHAMMFDDVHDVVIDGLETKHWPDAAPLLRMVNTLNAVIRGYSPKDAVETLLRLEGEATRNVVMEGCELGKVKETVSTSAEVDKNAFTKR